MKDLFLEYKKKRCRIKERLEDFRRVYDKGESDIFEELSFCLFTPQAKALLCDAAVKELKRSGLLFKGTIRQVARSIKGRVRFPNNKASFFVAARRTFSDGRKFRIKEMLSRADVFSTREWLVKNVKGLGYKEASHFLRNIGLGGNLAILDVHILKNLKRHGVIENIPPSISRKKYLEIEERMKGFSERADIPMDELDLLFWSQETGTVFK